MSPLPDDLKARAVVLRGQGWLIKRIAAELQVARSTAHRWTADVPLPNLHELYGLLLAVRYELIAGRKRPRRRR